MKETSSQFKSKNLEPALEQTEFFRLPSTKFNKTNLNCLGQYTEKITFQGEHVSLTTA